MLNMVVVFFDDQTFKQYVGVHDFIVKVTDGLT